MVKCLFSLQCYRNARTNKWNFRIREEELWKAADVLFLDRRLRFSCDFHGQSLLKLSKREGSYLKYRSFIKCWQTLDVTKVDLIQSLLLKGCHFSKTAHLHVNKCKLSSITQKTILNTIEKLTFPDLTTFAYSSFTNYYIMLSPKSTSLHKLFLVPGALPSQSSLDKFPLVFQYLVQSHFNCEAFPG